MDDNYIYHVNAWRPDYIRDFAQCDTQEIFDAAMKGVVIENPVIINFLFHQASAEQLYRILIHNPDSPIVRTALIRSNAIGILIEAFIAYRGDDFFYHILANAHPGELADLLKRTDLTYRKELAVLIKFIENDDEDLIPHECVDKETLEEALIIAGKR